MRNSLKEKLQGATVINSTTYVQNQKIKRREAAAVVKNSREALVAALQFGDVSADITFHLEGSKRQKSGPIRGKQRVADRFMEHSSEREEQRGSISKRSVREASKQTSREKRDFMQENDQIISRESVGKKKLKYNDENRSQVLNHQDDDSERKLYIDSRQNERPIEQQEVQNLCISTNNFQCIIPAADEKDSITQLIHILKMMPANNELFKAQGMPPAWSDEVDKHKMYFDKLHRRVIEKIERDQEERRAYSEKIASLEKNIKTIERQHIWTDLTTTDFQILREIGSGAYGTVLLAKFVKTNTQYALKKVTLLAFVIIFILGLIRCKRRTRLRQPTTAKRF